MGVTVGACIRVTLIIKREYTFIARVDETTKLDNVPFLCYNVDAMGGSEKKNPLRPSYEDGQIRDKKVARKQRSDFQPKDLLRLIRKAVGQPSSEG